MLATAVISAARLVHWESCRAIGADLVAAYRALNGVNEYPLADAEARACLQLAGRIAQDAPERIVLAEHAPHPARLLAALRQAYGGRALPPVYIHVYGDFLLGGGAWSACAKEIEGLRLQWICASARHALLVRRLLRAPSGAVEVCPFPVDVSLFRPDASARAEWRRRLGCEAGELLAVYGGRISLQKNVEALIGAVGPFRLAIAGAFDDLGAPRLGVREPLNGSFQRFQRALAGRNAIYLGKLSRTEMAGFYNAADAYVSLSLHHDEDFGLAPAEALCTGAPAVLSDWGGYSGFVSEVEGDCRLVPARSGETAGFRLQTAKVMEALLALPQEENFAGREERAARYRARYSVEAVGEILKAILAREPEPFRGFDEVLATADARLSADRAFYKFVYEPYFG